MVKGIHFKKRRLCQLACLGAGIGLGFLSQYTGVSSISPEQGLPRNPKGQGQASYELIVRGLDSGGLPLELTLEEQEYTQKEAYELYERILAELPAYILGENASLQEVRTDLDLVSGLDEYGVDFKWQSEDPDLVDSFGGVNSEGLPDQGRETALRLRITDGSWPRDFVIPICVKPPLLGDEERREKAFLDLVQKEEEAQRTEA